MKIVQSKKVQAGLMLTATVSGQTDGKSKLRSRNYYQLFIIITIINSTIIIITEIIIVIFLQRSDVLKNLVSILTFHFI